jgi:hypothetical protein
MTLGATVKFASSGKGEQGGWLGFSPTNHFSIISFFVRLKH